MNSMLLYSIVLILLYNSITPLISLQSLNSRFFLLFVSFSSSSSFLLIICSRHLKNMETKTEVDSVSLDKNSEIQPSENTHTDSVSLTVENPVSGSEQPTERPSNVNKRGSFFICGMRVPKPFYYLIWSLLYVCFAPVVYVFLTVATVAILPLLFTVSVFERLFQFIVNDNYFQRNQFKLLLRYWTFVFVMLLLVEVGLFYPIAKYTPGLKLVSAIGLPITKWIEIICILSGIYIMKQLILLSLVYTVVGVFRVGFGRRFVLIRDSGYEIVGCLLFLWAEVVVMNSVPTFKQSNIFGIYTRKWIEVSVFVLIGYNIITLLTHLFVWSLPEIYGHHPRVGEKYNNVLSIVCCGEVAKGAFNQKYVVYVATGIKRSIIFILNMVMLLVIWVVYFGNRLDTTPQDQRVLEFGTWTIVSMLLCSFLWLVKSCLLLYWEARSVYDRLHSKISAIGKQLYFLIMLSHTNYWMVIESLKDGSNVVDSGPACCKTSPKKKAQWVLLDAFSAGVEGYHVYDRKNARAYLINQLNPESRNYLDPKESSTYNLQEAAEVFLAAEYALSKESIVNELDHLQCNDSGENNEKCIQTLMKIVQVQDDPYFDKDWDMLLELLPDVTKTEDTTFQKVKIFMERARNSCMSLTNTFISEKEVVNCLNQVMGWIIIAAIFIMWLLVTGLATTKVLILIGSPVVGA
ncbi:uncharacterized protein LOC141619423 isoform X2 [Silene latifolia]|uniref:uncharacterized protein LOC141619423 isoform X2 n=1 Tax=Silene latifolia TaxID=37657 RepID=UPI003D77B53C